MAIQIDATEVARIKEIFEDDDAIEKLVADKAIRSEVVSYLRKVRENIREAETKGKRATKKAARGEIEDKLSTMTADDILNLPISELKG